MTRVLFFYISMSSGHQRAADAIREAFSLLAPNWETHGVDSLSYAYPRIGKLIARSYLEMLRHTPAFWNYIYDNPDVEEATREIREVLNLISSPKMKTLVQKYSPEAIVCTQAVPCSVFAREKRQGKLSIPLIAVVTDFAIHTYWVYDEVDLYCVPSEAMRKDLIRRGIPNQKIAVTGIPISPSFLRRIPKDQACARIRLDPHKPTALIMGGSQGLGPLQETIEKLHHLPLQCVVATGVNRDLFRLLQKKYRRDKKVKLFGYTRSIGTLMDACDFLITKPGGLTSSEALAKDLPMVITNPIPGQEERNADFLLDHGVAERADDPDSVASLVQNLLHHPNKVKKMAEKTKDIAAPYAAMEIARHIFRVIAASSSNRRTAPNKTEGRSVWGKRSQFWGL